MSLWQGKRQEARVKRVWAILHFFTQFGFIVFTYLLVPQSASQKSKIKSQKSKIIGRNVYN
ncbi:MAG: hypothetical protein HEQ13_05630 [Dolichospermum sp. DEX189]|uniref:hypothetical protein n=1 Tax=Aphanizomenon flos-aquae TaxID=1176 RepID=UPI000B208BAC|nr:hypothetical protein [Aphanizomenon flos-aquae]MBO1068875.1 hypothetical protein [Dolichospermum sp. DEX189]QSV70031.1 MAG: hypothetical protein HEQ20_03735 [Aphanizomenon flos-aquae KM1D3_PB]